MELGATLIPKKRLMDFTNDRCSRCGRRSAELLTMLGSTVGYCEQCRDLVSSLRPGPMVAARVAAIALSQ